MCRRGRSSAVERQLPKLAPSWHVKKTFLDQHCSHARRLIIGEVMFPSVYTARGRIPTHQSISAWLRYSQPRRTPRTYSHYAMVIDRFKPYAPLDMADLTVEHIERYLTKLLTANSRNPGRMANAHLTAIKSFCRWSAERYEVPNPAAKIKMLPEKPPRQRVLTPTEYASVLRICRGLESDAITLLGHTGLRASEFRSLTWANVADDLRSLSITGKGRKHRLIPLNQTCQTCLRKYERSHSTTMDFVKSYHARDALYKLCKRLAKRAEINRFGPHAIRHYFATELLRRGVPIAKVSKILGHASIRTTEQIYIHWLPDDLAGATDVLDWI